MVLRDIIYWFSRRVRGDRGSLSLAGLSLAVLAGVVVPEALVALVGLSSWAFSLVAFPGIEGLAECDVLGGVSVKAILASLRFLTFAGFGIVRHR